MDHAIPTVNPYPPHPLSSYFGTYAQNTHNMHETSSWILTLNRLHSQKGYLDDLLAKTATTLNALRERQTRSERALSMNPKPRAKRKKIQQDRWRTCRTIQTCENEERVILDCLQVCNNNISTLEAIVNRGDLSSTTVECNPRDSVVDVDTTSFDWNGWTDEAPISPFVKDRVRLYSIDEVPPKTLLGMTGPEQPSRRSTRCPPPLSPRSQPGPTARLPEVPPDTAHSQSNLSPEAAVFEPSAVHNRPTNNEPSVELDKLSISGLLASKRMLLLQKRRFSDIDTDHGHHRLPGECPAGDQLRPWQNWAAPIPEQQSGETVRRQPMKRTHSV
jgi:hypothetical protein